MFMTVLFAGENSNIPAFVYCTDPQLRKISLSIVVRYLRRKTYMK